MIYWEVNKMNGKQIAGKNSLPLELMIGRLPSTLGFPISNLRANGRNESIQAHSVELEGGEIYVVVQGRKEPYIASRAVVSWEKPMNVGMLVIDQPLDPNEVVEEDERYFEIGRFIFEGERENVSSYAEEQEQLQKEQMSRVMLDPDIVLQTNQGEIKINQASGRPTFYVKDCKVKYKE